MAGQEQVMMLLEVTTASLSHKGLPIFTSIQHMLHGIR